MDVLADLSRVHFHEGEDLRAGVREGSGRRSCRPARRPRRPHPSGPSEGSASGNAPCRRETPVGQYLRVGAGKAGQAPSRHRRSVAGTWASRRTRGPQTKQQVVVLRPAPGPGSLRRPPRPGSAGRTSGGPAGHSTKSCRAMSSGSDGCIEPVLVAPGTITDRSPRGSTRPRSRRRPPSDRPP